MQKNNLIKSIIHSGLKKNLIKLRREGNFFNLKMVIHKRHTANIILYGTRSGIRQCLLLWLLFTIILEVLANAIRQKKPNKRSLDWKGLGNVHYIKDDIIDMLFHVGNQMKSTKKLLEPLSSARLKKTEINQLYLYITAAKKRKLKLKKYHLQSYQT